MALFAISINFLQPLAHAALLRHGGSVATLLWKSMCAAEAADERSLPQQQHQTTQCCLGLACPAALPAIETAFVLVQYALDIDRRPVVAIDALAPVGIRDGPPQPHGPPLTV